MYATVADMIDVFDEEEVIQLTDREQFGEVNHDRCANALKRASIKIDTYLSRYKLPFDSNPDALIEPCCAIARYLLCGSVTQETELIKDRYDDAIRWLGKVASGAVTLGITSSGESVTTEDDIVVFSNADNKIFSRNRTRI